MGPVRHPDGATESHLGAAQSVRVRYHAVGLGLADAVTVALAADYDTDAILTLDRRDFRAVRPSGRHKAFRSSRTTFRSEAAVQGLVGMARGGPP
ncbi:hypothetical protein GCM10010104_06030 [Streptomyces indiaensis]|uniref:PIN domain-containing protein n=1 Tax=Streptomyces indiaensis TaxID=284033 RepID=A0ABN3D4M3_9ACTN